MKIVRRIFKVIIISKFLRTPKNSNLFKSLNLQGQQQRNLKTLK